MARALASPSHTVLRRLLVEARKDAQLTQQQVAAKLGLPQSYVSKYENGERKLDVIEFLAVCDVLGASTADIIENIRRSASSSTSGLWTLEPSR